MRIAFAALLLASCASAPAPSWSSGKSVGTRRPTPAPEVSKLAPGTEMVLEGAVSRVCKHRGCWVEVEGVMAKSFEHDVLFPKDCEGRRARILGIVRHQETGEKKGDGCPQPRIVVEILGAELF